MDRYHHHPPGARQKTISDLRNRELSYRLLPGTTIAVQIPSNVSALQIEVRALVVGRLQQIAMLTIRPQTPTNIPLIASYDMLEAALGLSPFSAPTPSLWSRPCPAPTRGQGYIPTHVVTDVAAVAFPYAGHGLNFALCRLEKLTGTCRWIQITLGTRKRSWKSERG